MSSDSHNKEIIDANTVVDSVSLQPISPGKDESEPEIDENDSDLKFLETGVIDDDEVLDPAGEGDDKEDKKYDGRGTPAPSTVGVKSKPNGGTKQQK